MRRVQLLCFGCVLSVLACAPWTTGAWSGQLIILPGAQNQVYGDVTGGLFNAPVGGSLTPIPATGLTFLKAFSQVKGPPAMTNQTVTTSQTGAANPTFKQLPAFATGTFIPVPKGNGARGYNFVGPPVIVNGGTVSVRNPQGYGQAKGNIAAAGSSETIISNTGSYYGAAGQFNVGGKKYTAAGAANILPFGTGPTGSAAASAYDPYSLTPGTTYGYSPEIDVIINPNTAVGETGGVHLFAIDSNSAPDIDSFDEDGEPVAEDLWTLDITEDSSGNPVVDFELNPDNPADSEIAFALPYLQSVDPADCMADANCEADDTASVDAAIDASKDSLIEAAFVDTAGDDVLTDFFLFGTYDNGGVPTDDATYTPCTAAGCATTVEYGDGIDAGLDVPEPGALSLLAVGLAGLGVLRRRKTASFSRT